ncbi:hypothetical protein Ait01nite_089260 [Actinoplanes italicus]|uniref:Uncharacterized protein n=1 Tax=Actinoplanes italicus TaxID=113567 RepID=A0A2T0JIR6_9ACTN|nr:hypothetical protein [Actinoplanes italicus]PRX07342.1 hypothetical protein CLV67_14217 [Actinoplanes italicus]GIE35881.1 hypothetical protein Ait01nite_089260 [Actinoplanes italicus]
MSYPPGHDHHPASPPPPVQPRPWLWIGAVALALVVGAGGTALAMSSSDEPASRTEQAIATVDEQLAQPTPAAAGTTTAAPSPAPVETPPVTAAKLSPQILDQECFGSAGCTVEFEIKLDWEGERVPLGTTWRVTYEVTGIEDGPMIGVFQLTHDRFDTVVRDADTKGPNAKIRIKTKLIELESA